MTQGERDIFADVYRFTNRALKTPFNDTYWGKVVCEAGKVIAKNSGNALCVGLMSAVLDYLGEVKVANDDKSSGGVERHT